MTMAEEIMDLDEGGWLVEGQQSAPTTRFSWRDDPEESHSDWKIIVRLEDDDNDNDNNDTDAERKKTTGTTTTTTTCYNVHKILMSSGPRSSGYFHAQFSKHNSYTIESKMSVTTLELPSICAVCMPQLLDYIYEGSLELDEDADAEDTNKNTALVMMELARRFIIPSLGKECMSWVKEKLQQDDTEFALKAFVLSGSTLCMEKVCNESFKVIARKFNKINPDLLVSTLPYETILRLLRLDELGDLGGDEDNVYDVIVAACENEDNGLSLSNDQMQDLWLCCRFAHLSDQNQLALLQPESLTRNIFLEDAYAYIHCLDDTATNISQECKERMKKRRQVNGLLTTRNSDSMIIDGNVLKSSDDMVCFMVLPECPPNAPASRQHLKNFTVPVGWKIVDTSDADFEVVRTKVIAAYEWGTIDVFVKEGNSFKGFETQFFSTGGKPSDNHCVLSQIGDNEFRFTGDGYGSVITGGYHNRLLVRKSA